MRKVLLWVLGLVAAALAGWGATVFASGWRVIGRIEQMEQVELARMPVDLSRPGTYEGTLEHRFKVPHQNPIILIVETPGSTFADTDNVLCGLTTEVTIRTPAGTEREPVELEARYVLHAPDWACRPSFVAFSLGEPGTYGFAMEVKTEAPALAGHRQELVVKYSVCRLEVLLGRMLQTLAIGCWIIAGIILLVLRHFHRKRQRTTEDRTVPAP